MGEFTINEYFCPVDIESPEGVAVDWISRRLYWTDSKKDTIEVAALDNPKNRAVIIKRDLINPRGLAVDPHSRYAKKKTCSRHKQKLFTFVFYSTSTANSIGPIGIVRDRKSNGPIWMAQNVAFY